MLEAILSLNYRSRPSAYEVDPFRILGIMATSPKLLVDLFPELSSELEQLLFEQGESELAREVSTLSVVDRCHCGDDFCGMFYVLPKPSGGYGPGSPQRLIRPETRDADTGRCCGQNCRGRGPI